MANSRSESAKKQIPWTSLAFMCFSTLWGFGNVANAYMYFNGTQVIFSWLWMFALYFTRMPSWWASWEAPSRTAAAA